MKNKKLYTKLLLAGSLLVMSGAFTSCDDYLTLYPTDSLPEENFWQDKTDLDGVRAYAYDQMASSTEKILIWGELRGDNLTLNNVSNTDISNLQDAILQPSKSMFDWSAFYTGINACNMVIEKGYDMTDPGKEIDPSFVRSDYSVYKAEMLALRSLYYFYLVRAYRDVPYVTASIRTDKEALAAKPASSSGVAILGACINDLKENVGNAARNFGSSAENKGRFTKKGIYALIADMSLWRACMLKDFASKDNEVGNVNFSDVLAEDGTWTTDSGTVINDSYCNNLAKECLEDAKTYADLAIDDLRTDYGEELDKNPSNVTSEQREQLEKYYPLYLNERQGVGVSDNSYYRNFGLQNSLESIFELQYDGTSTTNSVVNSYFSTYSNNKFTPAAMNLSTELVSSASTVNPTVGFGKTDFRLLETCDYSSIETYKPITKFVLQQFSVNDIEDLTESNSQTGISARTSSSNNAHWAVYRLSDVMLIKAEAIARLGVINNTISADDKKEGYLLINEIFRRNNPGLVTPEEAAANSKKQNLGCDRMKREDYDVSSKTAAGLLSDVYRERQREFVGEGKRWFDLVRQAEYSYVSSDKDTSPALGYGSFKSSVKSRLKSLYALYNPIYSEELKVNGVGYVDGGQLKQNKVWDRYTKK